MKIMANNENKKEMTDETKVKFLDELVKLQQEIISTKSDELMKYALSLNSADNKHIAAEIGFRTEKDDNDNDVWRFSSTYEGNMSYLGTLLGYYVYVTCNENIGMVNNIMKSMVQTIERIPEAQKKMQDEDVWSNDLPESWANLLKLLLGEVAYFGLNLNNIAEKCGVDLREVQTIADNNREVQAE